MRITFVLPSFPWRPVGGFRVVYEYANHLVARGHLVSVVHPMRPWNLRPEPGTTAYRKLRHRAGLIRERILRPTLRWQPIDPRVCMLYVPSLASENVPDADAIFATARRTAEHVNAYLPSKGEKFYLIQHYETWAGPKDRVDATWKMPLHKVVIADWLYDIGRAMGCGDMVKIPNGFDHTRFRLLAPITERRKSLAMMFSHLEWKGSVDGLAALNIARAKHPDLKVTLFGVTQRPKSLPVWVEYRTNPPQRSLVEDIYNQARIFVCPSWTEGFPLPPAESMACGCALASTSCTGITEYAEHGATALLSPVQDPAALAENILRLLDDDDLRVRIATEGHRRIQTLRWPRSTDLLERFIEDRVWRALPAGNREAVKGRLPKESEAVY